MESYRGRRSHPFTYILKVCVVCAFVPILNSLFYALNSSYYARWYYMPVLILCAMTASALESPDISADELDAPVRGIGWLMRHQGTDGLWPQEHFTGGGFPRVFYLRYHGYAKFFPLWALARYRNLKRANDRVVHVGL